MGHWQVYTRKGEYRRDGDGSAVVISSLSYNSKLMGEESVTATVKSPTVIRWTIGDYIEYRGHRYVLSATPSVQKQASVRSVGNAIVYDSIKFVSLAGDDMTRCDFRDIVLGEEDGHYNFAARQFAFHCVSLIDFANRVKANLDRLCPDTETWRVFTLCADARGEYYYESGKEDYREDAYETAHDMSGRPIRHWRNHNDAYGKKNVVVNISEQKVWDALQNVKDVFDVNFVIIDRCLYLGSNGRVVNQQFRYGRSEDGTGIDTSHGLFKIERNTDDSQAVVTRLRAYGSEKNMQHRYYQNVAMTCFIPVGGLTSSEDDYDGKHRLHIDLPYDVAIRLRFASTYTLEGFEEVNMTFARFDCSIAGVDVSGATLGMRASDETVSLSLPCTAGEAADITEEMEHNSDARIVVKTNTNAAKWPIELKTIDPSFVMPNNMSVQNLMLPGFGYAGNSLRKEVQRIYESSSPSDALFREKIPYKTFDDLCKVYRFSDDPTDPYIEALPQVEEYGIREQSVTFDGSGDEDEIYPSIEYVMGVDADGETLAKVVSSTLPVEDGGIVDDEDPRYNEHMHFDIVTPYIEGLDIDTCNAEGNGKVSIIDGRCGGMTFDIDGSAKTSDDRKTITIHCKRNTSPSIANLNFPYRDPRGDAYSFDIRKGDRFVLIDMDMPKAYVDGSAKYALLPAALEYLDKNRDMRYKYSLTVDNIHLQRQHDAVMEMVRLEQMESGTDSMIEESIYWTIKAGDLVMFGDDDLGIKSDPREPDTITGSILIDSVEIKENEGRVPHVTVQLVDEVSVGTLQTMQKQIDGIVKGTITVGSAQNAGGGGYSAGDIQRMVRTLGGAMFLSKTGDDVARGRIHMTGETDGVALDFGRTATTGTPSNGVYRDTNGAWHARFDFIHVMRKATFAELEVQKMSHIGGAYIQSAASCTIDHTATSTELNLGSEPFVRCYFGATDGERRISNNWKVGDQAICKTFNLEPDSDGTSSNHYWWRLVVGTGTTADKRWHFIDVSVADCDNGSDLPWDGDEVVLLGYRYDDNRSRQNAIMQAGAGEESPYTRYYRGVNGYSLEGKARLDLNADHPTIDVESLTITTSGGSTKNAGAILSEGFEIYSLDMEAPRDDDGNFATNVPLGTDGWPDTVEEWTEDSYAGHADPGDVAIATDGVYYKFADLSVIGGIGYGWLLITDEYLIQAIRQSEAALRAANSALSDIADMADDELVTPDEKLRMRKRLAEMQSAYSGIMDEAGTFGVSPTGFISAHNMLVAFMEWIIAQEGTTKLKDGSHELGIVMWEQPMLRSYQYEVRYFTRRVGVLAVEKTYDEVMQRYSDQYAILRRNITNGVYTKLHDISVEGGYDAEIASNIQKLWTAFGAYAEDQNSEEPIYKNFTSFAPDMTSLSNWWHSPTGADMGSGLVTTERYASLFSTAKGSDGSLLAEALANTYVAIDYERDADGNIVLDERGNPVGKWISGFKIKADEIVVETDNFGISEDGEVYVYGSVTQKPKHVNKSNFLKVMSVFMEAQELGKKFIDYDYDFLRHSRCVIFDDDLSDILHETDTEMTRVYIQMPGSKPLTKIEDMLSVANMTGERVIVVNNSNSDRIGVNANGFSMPIPKGHYVMFVLTKVTDAKGATSYRWEEDARGNIYKIDITS